VKIIEDEREFLKPFRGKDNYIMPNSFIFCSKCSAMLLDPADLWEIALERCAMWQHQKVWWKHWQHIAAFKVTCRTCGHENFMALVFLRYNNRVKWFALGFKTQQQLLKFLESQRRQNKHFTK